MEKAQRPASAADDRSRPTAGPARRPWSRSRSARRSWRWRVRLGHQHRQGAEPQTTPPTTGPNAPIDKTLGGRRDRRPRSRSASRSSTSTQIKTVHRHDPHRSGAEADLRDLHQRHQRARRHQRPQDRARLQVLRPLGTAQIVPLCTIVRAGRQRVRGRRHVHRLLRRRADLHREAAAARAHDVQPDAGDHRQVAARAHRDRRAHPRTIGRDPARAAARRKARSRARPSRCSATRPRRPS